MIYIFKNEDDNPRTIAVLEGPDGFDIYQLYKDYLKEWWRDLDWSKDKYDYLQITEGYDVARAYLQKWRDGYSSRISELGLPGNAFTKLLIKDYGFKKIHYSHIYLDEETP